MRELIPGRDRIYVLLGNVNLVGKIKISTHLLYGYILLCIIFRNQKKKEAGRITITYFTETTYNYRNIGK